MSAPMGADRSVEIPLHGYVTLQDVCSHVGEIWRRARQQQGLLFALDCSAVLDFSTLALTALGRLRKHLREFGCELALVKSSPSVLERQDDPLVAPLLTAAVPDPASLADTQPLPRKNRLSKKTASRRQGPRPADAASRPADREGISAVLAELAWRVGHGSSRGNTAVAARFQRAGSFRHVGNVPPQPCYLNRPGSEPCRDAER